MLTNYIYICITINNFHIYGKRSYKATRAVSSQILIILATQVLLSVHGEPITHSQKDTVLTHFLREQACKWSQHIFSNILKSSLDHLQNLSRNLRQAPPSLIVWRLWCTLYIYLPVHVHTYMCMWKSEINAKDSPQSLHLTLWDKVFQWTWS